MALRDPKSCLDKALMNLDVSDSITWLGEGCCENAGEKSENSASSHSCSNPSLLCRITCWNLKICVCLVEMGIVVCLTAPVMLQILPEIPCDGRWAAAMSDLWNQWELLVMGWESKNHWIIWVGRDLQRSSVPTPKGWKGWRRVLMRQKPSLRGNTVLLCWVGQVGCDCALLQGKEVLKLSWNCKNASTYLPQSKPPKLSLIFTLKWCLWSQL